jgi:hypothetical protein
MEAWNVQGRPFNWECTRDFVHQGNEFNLYLDNAYGMMALVVNGKLAGSGKDTIEVTDEELLPMYYVLGPAYGYNYGQVFIAIP